MLSPTGGWISPISILMVMITPNQTGSNPAVVMIGYRIGEVIRMIAAGGMKNPATSKNRLMSSINTHLLTCISAMACANVCVR
jgi:hypothetical protein